jgi:hypothetical protein
MVGKWKLEGRELEGSPAEVYVFVAVGYVSLVESSLVDVGELVTVERVSVIGLDF